MRRALAGVLLCPGILAIGGCEQPAAPRSFTVLSEAASPPASPAPPDPLLWETPQADPRLEAGRQVWIGTCIACHSTGLGGAPLIGNRKLWAPRIAKGFETLVEHATNGFYGQVGEMPARGGNEDLSDEQVRAAVLFMASRAGKL
jgi:cytochrome c5